MTSQKLYYSLLVTVGLLVVTLFGGAYVADQLLQKHSKRLVDARLQSQALDLQQQQLARTKADIAKYQQLATIAKGIVPQDKDQAVTINEIVRIAAANGVKLGSITFPSSTLGATTAGGGRSQLKAVPGIAGVYSMPITVQSDAATTVPYDKFISFLAALEKNRRTALISAINLQPSQAASGTVAFTLTIDEYVKP